MLKCQESFGGKQWPMGLEHGQKLRQRQEETRQANMESERNTRVSESPRSDKVWCDKGRQGHGILGHSCSGLSQPQAHPSSTIPQTSRPGRPISSHGWRGWGVSDQAAPPRPHICEWRHGPGTSLWGRTFLHEGGQLRGNENSNTLFYSITVLIWLKL